MRERAKSGARTKKSERGEGRSRERNGLSLLFPSPPLSSLEVRFSTISKRKRRGNSQSTNKRPGCLFNSGLLGWRGGGGGGRGSAYSRLGANQGGRLFEVGFYSRLGVY